ncbi:unnamed protein product [Closterium sp. Naga37s-1]|nr:unnamed protein product [Closterium sp. Naga37s-1]
MTRRLLLPVLVLLAAFSGAPRSGALIPRSFRCGRPETSFHRAAYSSSNHDPPAATTRSSPPRRFLRCAHPLLVQVRASPARSGARIPCSFRCAYSRPLGCAHSIASSGSASLPDGATCYLDSERRPVYPFCRGNKRNCVVTQVPTAPQAKYVGRCNSTYTRGSFCRYAGTPYAVGTKGVQGNALCKTCDCTYRRKMPGPNRAVCSCSSLPACYVDYNGQPVRKFRCPEEQNMCVITKIRGGGKDKKGLPVDKGVCVFSGIQGICGAAGPSWGPKFYMAGTEGMPKPQGTAAPSDTCSCSALTTPFPLPSPTPI